MSRGVRLIQSARVPLTEETLASGEINYASIVNQPKEKKVIQPNYSLAAASCH
jgi:hypothetical protein